MERNEITENNKNRTHTFLLLVLLLSLICFVGIVIYASNWETIRTQMMETQPETLEVNYEIATMTHQMPVLTKTAGEDTEIIQVPLISQAESGYKTGCELVSAAMLLNYYGFETTAKQVYEAIEKVPAPVGENQIGVDPQTYFIGNPEGQSGYGCYAEALVAAMNRILNGDRYAVNITGTELQTIENSYISKETPVIIWATIHMSEPQQGDSWLLEDGTEFQWIAGEHCLVLVGADEQYYYFNDPDQSETVIGYEKDLVEQRYQQLGKQAVIISR